MVSGVNPRAKCDRDFHPSRLFSFTPLDWPLPSMWVEERDARKYASPFSPRVWWNQNLMHCIPTAPKLSPDPTNHASMLPSLLSVYPDSFLSLLNLLLETSPLLPLPHPFQIRHPSSRKPSPTSSKNAQTRESPTWENKPTHAWSPQISSPQSLPRTVWSTCTSNAPIWTTPARCSIECPNQIRFRGTRWSLVTRVVGWSALHGPFLTGCQKGMWYHGTLWFRGT